MIPRTESILINRGVYFKSKEMGGRGPEPCRDSCPGPTTSLGDVTANGRVQE